MGGSLFLFVCLFCCDLIPDQKQLKAIILSPGSGDTDYHGGKRKITVGCMFTFQGTGSRGSGMAVFR